MTFKGHSRLSEMSRSIERI